MNMDDFSSFWSFLVKLDAVGRVLKAGVVGNDGGELGTVVDGAGGEKTVVLSEISSVVAFLPDFMFFLFSTNVGDSDVASRV